MEFLLTIFLVSLLPGQLGGISFAPTVTVYIHDMMLVVLLLIGSFWVLKKKKAVQPKLLLPIAAFLVAGVLSLAANALKFRLPELFEASLYLIRFAAYAGLYWLLVQGFVSANVVSTRLFWVGVGISVLGFIQYRWYPDLRNLSYLGWDPHYFRLFSTLLDPNYAGIIIVLTFLLGLYLLEKKQSFVIVAGEAMNCIALYLTYSRSAYLAFVLSLFTYIVMRKQWRLVLVVLAFVGALLIIPKMGNTQTLTRSVSSVARIGNWQESFVLIAQAPIFGHGFDTLRYVHKAAGSPSSAVSKAAAGVDSSVLFILATTGIIGFVAYAWMMISWVKRQPNAMTVAVLVALLSHSLFNNSLFYPWVVIWFWVFVASEELETYRLNVGR